MKLVLLSSVNFGFVFQSFSTFSISDDDHHQSCKSTLTCTITTTIIKKSIHPSSCGIHFTHYLRIPLLFLVIAAILRATIKTLRFTSLYTISVFPFLFSNKIVVFPWNFAIMTRLIFIMYLQSEGRQKRQPERKLVFPWAVS